MKAVPFYFALDCAEVNKIILHYITIHHRDITLYYYHHRQKRKTSQTLVISAFG